MPLLSVQLIMCVWGVGDLAIPRSRKSSDDIDAKRVVQATVCGSFMHVGKEGTRTTEQG